MFDIARMFHVEGGYEAVREWPLRKYRKYRAYWLEHYRRDLMKRGIDPDPPKEDEDDKSGKGRWWVERDDASPLKHSSFRDEVTVVRE